MIYCIQVISKVIFFVFKWAYKSCCIKCFRRGSVTCERHIFNCVFEFWVTCNSRTVCIVLIDLLQFALMFQFHSNHVSILKYLTSNLRQKCPQYAYIPRFSNLKKTFSSEFKMERNAYRVNFCIEFDQVISFGFKGSVSMHRLWIIMNSKRNIGKEVAKNDPRMTFTLPW